MDSHCTMRIINWRNSNSIADWFSACQTSDLCILLHALLLQISPFLLTWKQTNGFWFFMLHGHTTFHNETVRK